MSTETALSSLVAPGLQLRNRVAFLASVNNLGRNRQITDEQIAFYEARARGGAGLIITEGLSVHPTSVPNGTVPLAYDVLMIDGFARMARAVHSHGAKIVGQLWHVGRQALWNPSLQPWSPSGERDPYSGSTPHAMTESEIAAVIRGYVDSAVNLKQAGFDGIELHGAHGYLITQFLSPFSNLREDGYGGDTEGRCRMLVEAIQGIREACGPDFILGLKLSAHEYVPGGLDLEETQRIVTLLTRTALPDYLAVSQANFSPSLEKHVPDMTFPDVPFAELSAGVRQAADGVPVMALAKVPDIATGSRLIDEGTADLVGMARAWIADANLVTRTANGATPRPCTYCNICWDFIHTGRAVACMYAPETGREATYVAESELPTGTGRIRIVGAGPAGLEAARVAAGRGYDVDVHEAEPEVGGRLTWESRIPGRDRMGVAAGWLVEAARSAGARIHTNDRVDKARALDWAAEGKVVVATGAKPVVEPLTGANPISLEDAWEQRGTLAGPVVIVDEVEDEPVYAIATGLAEAGLEVHIVTRRDALARRVAYVSRIGLLRRLDDHGITIHTLIVPRRVVDGRLVASHIFSGREREICSATSIVRAGPYSAHVPDWANGTDAVVIGDASAPRGYVAVTREANEVSATLGVNADDLREAVR